MSKHEISLLSAAGTDVFRSVVRAGGSYEAEVAGVLMDFFSGARRSLLLNVGSNIGIYPLACSRLVTAGLADVEIFAHEPLPHLHEIARNLMAENGLDYVLSPVALGDFRGRAEFYVSAKSDSSSSLVKGFRPAKTVLDVQVDTVDDLYLGLAESGGFERIVLVIDVETAEPKVLRGGSRFIRSHRPFIICEVLADRVESEIAALLVELDYAFYRFDGGAWVREGRVWGDKSYSFKDWLFVPNERVEAWGDRYVPSSQAEVSFRTDPLV